MALRREGISRLPTPANVMRVKVPARSRIGFISFNRCVKAIKVYIRMGLNEFLAAFSIREKLNFVRKPQGGMEFHIGGAH
jgi:hypothetical protein